MKGSYTMVGVPRSRVSGDRPGKAYERAWSAARKGKSALGEGSLRQERPLLRFDERNPDEQEVQAEWNEAE
jgi:hypothetical protein